MSEHDYCGDYMALWTDAKPLTVEDLQRAVNAMMREEPRPLLVCPNGCRFLGDDLEMERHCSENHPGVAPR